MKINPFTLLASLVVAIFLTGCTGVLPPAPFGALPTDRQLQWHKMKYYAFIHFSPNTFTGKEWGFGDEPESIFDPTELDCRQWARVAKEAGMEGIIITAKHHDGFCLWPSAYTEHSVKNSPWKEGKGDLLKELREACDEYGLKMGIYLSPWDRNHAAYGKDEYITYYRDQLTELMTQYGEIFEVWFDGANGGDGYYGGANETRRIDNKTYYDWENTIRIVREHQPMAAMFSDGGPDIRWIGNERGYAAETNWCTIRGGLFYPGIGGVNKQLEEGHEDGDIWLPAEVNTSIRPGWFYHPNEDERVKSVEQLVDNWYHSVGMNGNFLLNLPVDRRGLVHENDIKALQGLKEYIDGAFSSDYSEKAKTSASNIRGNSKTFDASNVIDDDPESFWATDDDVRDASIVIGLREPKKMNAILLQEYIRLGQRAKSFRIEAFQEGTYKEIAAGTTIGNRRIVRFPVIETTGLRISIKGKAALLISNIEIYLTPELQ